MKSAQFLEWIVTICAVIGTVLMSYKISSVAFSLFCLGNLTAVGLFYLKGLKVTVYSNILFFFLNLNGFWLSLQG